MLKKKVNKNRDYLKTILFSIRFSQAPRNIWQKIVTEIWSQTHKNPLKTHIEALKIRNFLGGNPLTPLTRGEASLSCSTPLVPSALDDFLRRTTF